jgi:hypothetical protein
MRDEFENTDDRTEASAGPARTDSSEARTEGSPARRRFLKAGILAAPVILTVKSRPVWATHNLNTPSGAASLNPSH